MRRSGFRAAFFFCHAPVRTARASTFPCARRAYAAALQNLPSIAWCVLTFLGQWSVPRASRYGMRKRGNSCRFVRRMQNAVPLGRRTQEREAVVRMGMKCAEVVTVTAAVENGCQRIEKELHTHQASLPCTILNVVSPWILAPDHAMQARGGELLRILRGLGPCSGELMKHKSQSISRASPLSPRATQSHSWTDCKAAKFQMRQYP